MVPVENSGHVVGSVGADQDGGDAQIAARAKATRITRLVDRVSSLASSMGAGTQGVSPV